MKYVWLFTRTALLAVALVAVPVFAGAESPADDMLAKNVEEELMKGKQGFDATGIIVTADDGVVHLRGKTAKVKDVSAMKDAAMKIPGVRGVETQIDVEELEGN